MELRTGTLGTKCANGVCFHVTTPPPLLRGAPCYRTILFLHLTSQWQRKCETRCSTHILQVNLLQFCIPHWLYVLLLQAEISRCDANNTNTNTNTNQKLLVLVLSLQYTSYQKVFKQVSYLNRVYINSIF